MEYVFGYVRHLVDAVKSICRHGHHACIVREFHLMGTLFRSLFSEPTLQPSVTDKIVHKGRTVMYLDIDVANRCKVDMVIHWYSFWIRLFAHGNNLPDVTHCPHIDVTRNTVQRLRIHQGVALPFQDATAETVLSQSFGHLDSSHVHLLVCLSYLFRLEEPRQFHLLRQRDLFRQTGDALIDHTCQRLLGSHHVNWLPLIILDVWGLLLLADGIAQQAEKLLGRRGHRSKFGYRLSVKGYRLSDL